MSANRCNFVRCYKYDYGEGRKRLRGVQKEAVRSDKYYNIMIDRKRLFVICLLLVLLVLGRGGTAVAAGRAGEPMPYLFRPLSTTDLLPTNEVRKLYQDSDGFIWISTNNGLVRYDGYDYLSYRYRNKQPVFNGQVSAVREDPSHRLYIGTRNGLYTLDKKTGDVAKLLFPGLSESRIEALITDPHGNLYIATNTGLYIHYLDNDSLVHCVGEEWGIPQADIKTLLFDYTGQLYMGTWSSGLFRYDLRKRRLYRYDQIPALRSSHTLFLDRRNRIWVGTFGSGLVLLLDPYDMQQQPYRLFTHRAADPGSLLDDIVYCFAQEPQSGNLWIGSRSGLSLLVEDGDEVRFCNYSPTSKTHFLPYNEVDALLCSEDMLYLGSYGGGLLCADLTNRNIQTYPLQRLRERYGTSSIGCIYADGQSFWITLAGYGLIHYFPEDDTWQSFLDIPALRGYDCLRRTTYITGNEDELLFCTEKGPVRYSRKGKTAVRYAITCGDRFKDDFINYASYDRQGRLWLATRMDCGCLTDSGYVPLNDRLTAVQKPMPSAVFTSILEDRGRNLWIATRTDGVYLARRTDDGRYDLQHFALAAEGAECLLIDSDGRVWAGTEAGLFLYNADCQRFEECDYESFRCFSDYAVSALWEDAKQSLWAATNKGVVVLHPTDTHTTDYLHLFNREDGLLDDCFHRNCYAAAPNADILLGGANGISRIHSAAVAEAPRTGYLALTDFRVFNRSLRDMPSEECRRISTDAIDRTQRITLTHTQNNFTIDFALLNFRNPQNNRYAYRLEGFDADYIYCDARHRSAYYNHLPAGTYRFTVRASATGNDWTVRTSPLEITVLPAPWRTWWAYLLYALVFAGVTSAIAYMSIHRLRLRQTIQRQELQSRQAEELTQAKLQFFTNITHELLTPLSIITAAVDELRRGNTADSGYTRHAYDIISQNALRLIRLIRQILEFRKAESGNLRLKVAYGNVSQFVSGCVHSFEPLAHKQGLRFSCVLPEQDVMGWFDTDKLDKILYNLLSNASKYNRPNGEVRVEVSTTDGANTVVIKVADTGVGMSEETQKHLFHRFYDGEYRKQHTTGTGIGLALVKHLVDLHHGLLFVDSTLGVGTTFTLLLPVRREEYLESETEMTTPPNPLKEGEDSVSESLSFGEGGKIRIASSNAFDHTHSDTQTPPPLEGLGEVGTGDGASAGAVDGASAKHILFVDDNEDLVYIVRQHLQHTYRVSTATSAEQALDTLHADHTISLVVSDVVMDGISGYDLCATIKQTLEFSHIPVVLLTAKQAATDQVTGYEMGADAYLTKPFDLHVLDARIANLLLKQERQTIDYRHQLVFNLKEMDYTSLDRQFLQQAIDSVQRHIADAEFSPADFVEEMCVSRSTLSDKLKTLTGFTPSGFINDIRLRTAFTMLEKDPAIRVSELAYSVGFNDPKYFSTLFRKKFGVSPKDSGNSAKDSAVSSL